MKDPRASRPLVRLLPVLAIIALVLSPPEARAGSGLVKLTGCTTITKSGTYLLGVNISKTGDCFKIQADLVVFDLGGLSLTGKGSGAAITDNGNSVQGVVVRNGVISGFAEALHLPSAMTVQVEDILMTEQTGKNIQAGAGATVKNVTIDGGTDGILVGDGSAVSDCNVSGVSNDGIRVGDGSTVKGNTVSFAGNDGIQADCPSTVVQNTSTGSGSDNLILNGGGCTAADNTAP